MDIGTGLAIAGVWIFAGALGVSRTVTGSGFLFGIAVAIGVTIWLA